MPATPSILDADAYPHIFTSILSSAPYPALLVLRATSRGLRDALDARLARHILVFADGRIASRLAPRARLPRPLAEVAEHVRVVDIQPPIPSPNSVDGASAAQPSRSASDSLAAPASEPASTSVKRCRCGLPESAPAPHLRPLAALPNLSTVRRWGVHTCWSPRSAWGITHFPPEEEDTRIADEAMWYLHSPAAVSRFNRLHLPGGELERYSMGGERVAMLFEMVDAMGGVEACESADEEAAAEAAEAGEEDGEGEREGDGGERKKGAHASTADGFAALLAMFWLDGDDECECWTLVDVERWPAWRDTKGGEGDVARTIRERVRRCLVNADWEADELAAAEDKLRFISTEEYRREVGEEVAALEMDDHGWVF